MMPSPQVVIHLDEREKAGLALTSVKNLLAGLDGVEVEVVAHSDGVEGLLTGGPHVVLMEQLAGRGVRFALCENTLRSRNLALQDFPGYVETVPSGVVKLVTRQVEGWSYIRP